jgi:hypothetical protein
MTPACQLFDRHWRKVQADINHPKSDPVMQKLFFTMAAISPKDMDRLPVLWMFQGVAASGE